VLLDEPRWWYGSARSDAAIRSLLSPLARVYGHLAMRRYRGASPYRSGLPVICVGNFTAGGTGKTPLALRLAEELRHLGEAPIFLSRGYGARLAGPHWVEPGVDTSGETGDEPLLLAAAGPALVARDRQKGAIAIEARAIERAVIVMDDGLQNPALEKDLTIALVDGRRGVGNGEVIPAGPLRAPLEFQLGLVDGIVVNRGIEPGDAEQPAEAAFKRIFAGPVLSAHVEPCPGPDWPGEGRVLAYAGIANPERFFTTLERLGAEVAGRRVFPDHHAYSEGDARGLLEAARRMSARLVTTEKDLIRLKGRAGRLADLLRATTALRIRLAIDARNVERLRALIEGALKARRAGG